MRLTRGSTIGRERRRRVPRRRRRSGRRAPREASRRDGGRISDCRGGRRRDEGARRRRGRSVKGGATREDRRGAAAEGTRPAAAVVRAPTGRRAGFCLRFVVPRRGAAAAGMNHRALISPWGSPRFSGPLTPPPPRCRSPSPPLETSRNRSRRVCWKVSRRARARLGPGPSPSRRRDARALASIDAASTRKGPGDRTLAAPRGTWSETPLFWNGINEPESSAAISARSPSRRGKPGSGPAHPHVETACWLCSVGARRRGGGGARRAVATARTDNDADVVAQAFPNRRFQGAHRAPDGGGIPWSACVGQITGCYRAMHRGRIRGAEDGACLRGTACGGVCRARKPRRGSRRSDRPTRVRQRRLGDAR